MVSIAQEPQPERLASFEKINYAIRPAKSTERRMMIEAFGRLAAFFPLHQYQYVGFGSTFFIDFVSLHRQYGIKHMTSVEQEVAKQKRFDFNKPLSCVKMYYGTASRFLSSPAMKWRRPAIIWLDYDSPLSQETLADIDRVVEQARPGSFLSVTVDAEPRAIEDRLRLIDDTLGLSRLPLWVESKASRLGGWGLAKAFMEIASNSIKGTMSRARNGCRWEQVFHFNYNDGTRMLTFGGLIVDHETEDALEKCHFDELSYFSSSMVPFEIRVPNLTVPEMHRLSRELPNLTKRGRNALTQLAINDDDVLDYQRLYRYLPRFVEAHT